MYRGDLRDLNNAGNNNSGMIVENAKTEELNFTTEHNNNSNDFSRASAKNFQNFLSVNVGSRPNTPLAERGTEDLIKENRRLSIELSEERKRRECVEKEIKELKSHLYEEEKRAKEVSEDVNRLLDELYRLIKRVEKIYSRKTDAGSKNSNSGEHLCSSLSVVRDVKAAVNRLHETYQNAARKLAEAAHHREEAEFWRRRLSSGKRGITIADNEADAAKRLNDMLKQMFQLGFEPSENGSDDEVVIAIMSQTALGKSSFIWQLTGSHLKEATGKVNMYHCNREGRRVKLIDTPCFNNSFCQEGVTDIKVLKTIADFLSTKDGRRLNGIIYLHPIKEKAIPGKLKLFRDLCGKGAFNNVIVVTMQWDSMAVNEESICLSNERQLKSFFNSSVDSGVRYIRHTGSSESARWIAAQFFHNRPTILQIQEELQMGWQLERTAVGVELRVEVTILKEKQEVELRKFKDEMDRAVKANDKACKDKLGKYGQELMELLLRLTEQLDLLKEKFSAVREDLPKGKARGYERDYDEINSELSKMKAISCQMGQDGRTR